ncbi:MAG TPA: hypothetical protein VH740_16640 [Vicinamibacterales bacterium]
MPVERQAAPQQTLTVIRDDDARETREKLEELMRRLPPSVGRVLRADPSLMGNDAYLSTYPSLAAFLKQHPEIRTSSGFFFEHIGSYDFYNPDPSPRESNAVRFWREIFQFVAITGVFLTIAGVLIWIIRTLVEYRRWNRASKVHTEVHNKLLDRFTANEDLLAYMQTPAGKAFLESAPLPLESPARPVGAPYGRILWSLQVGIVLATAGIGLLYVSGRVVEEVAQAFFAIAVLSLAIGAGFVVSSGASMLLSRRLGLFDTPPATTKVRSIEDAN